MERNRSTAKSWSIRQIYMPSVLCLLLGIGAWYLAHSLSQTTSDIRLMERPGKPASAETITPDQLKQMADKQAAPLLAQLQKSPDDPFLLAEIGKIYYQTRQFPMAAKYYEDSVRVKPDAVVLVKLGGAYHFDRDYDKAIGAWNRALRLDPNNPDALFNIGFVQWYAQGNRKAAVAAWQKLLKTNPNHPKRAQVEELLTQAKQHPEAPMGRNE
jgi:cytochrome c-type biogenesis protein CcmH/NrfG